MKKSLRKVFGAVSAVFLIGLFVVAAAPVRATTTDERIKAMEEELARLKADQRQVKEEQSIMKQDALAARAKLPTFRYRGGRGLVIRAADRSWQITFGAKFSTHLAFFPGGPRSLVGTSSGSTIGPSQGSMAFRHTEVDFYYRLWGGLYEFGMTMPADRGGNGVRSKSQKMQIRFSQWSPYYPNFRILAISPGTYSPQTRVSSSSGDSMERAPSFDNRFSTGSSKGLALHWSDIPLGPMKIDTFTLNYLSGNIAWRSKRTSDPIPQKGFIGGIVLDPFAKSKNKYLKGLQTGFTWVTMVEDVNHGGSGENSRMRIRTRGRNNRVSIFEQDMRGRAHYIEPWMYWKGGPWSLGYTFGHMTAPADFSGKACSSEDDFEGDKADVTPCKFSEGKVDTHVISGGVFFWGPKGFMSGSRKGGWRFSYTHARTYMDSGSGFNKSFRPREDEGNLEVEGTSEDITDVNDKYRYRFEEMRRWNYIENILLVRWYQARNLHYSLEYQINSISKMKGGGRAENARRQLGVLETGGTYQIISINALWEF